MASMKDHTLRKYRDIKKDFHNQYEGLGIRRDRVIASLAWDYYLSESTVEAILWMNLDELETTTEDETCDQIE